MQLRAVQTAYCTKIVKGAKNLELGKQFISQEVHDTLQDNSYMLSKKKKVSVLEASVGFAYLEVNNVELKKHQVQNFLKRE